MCGIFGYIGVENASNKVIEGLKRLEYRGYDSWGVATFADHAIHLTKQKGKIGDITTVPLPQSNISIGHTRWATCGSVNDVNAHPHYASDQSFVLAHNGIVQNHNELKSELLSKGHNFISETDTEVIVRLIEEKRKTFNSFKEAVRNAFSDLDGRNTIIILKDKEIVAARNGSPLVLGINNNEIYLSSDTLSFAPYCNKMIVIENGQMVETSKDKIDVHDLKSNEKILYSIEDLDIKSDKVDKEGYDHFMLKEINENPYVIEQAIGVETEKYKDLAMAIRHAKTVYTIGSGTAGMAAAQIAFYLRHFGGINAIRLVGGDSREYFNLIKEGDLLISPSQSGETADVLEVLEIAKKKGAKIASHVNMPGSAMTRMSDFKFMANAGPEICVMSTKIFVSQIAWGYLLAKTVQGKYEEGKENLRKLVQSLTEFMNSEANLQKIKDLALKFASQQNIFLMGKGQNLQIMNEGMIKIIEGTYRHAHSIPAGDLKHYAITLMEEGVPVIAALSHDEVRSDMVNAIEEVTTRGAHVLGISSETSDLFTWHIQVPNMGEVSGIMNVIPLQLLAYYMTVSLGNSVDKPRNIAKSVTVK